jgi:hypothetical protein
MESWYRIEDSNDVRRIHFLPSRDRYWEPQVLASNPLPEIPRGVRRVVLTGPGAVWMYAHAAATCRAANIQKIGCESPSNPDGSDDLRDCECRVIPITFEGKQKALFQVKFRRDPPLSPRAIQHLIDSGLEEVRRLRADELVISGRAAVSVYAQVACTAVESSVRRLVCWSAIDGLIIVFDANLQDLGLRINRPPWLAEIMPKPVRSVVIGVVGDPNVGKSVFSTILNTYQDRRGIGGWRLDCDGQSPTPHWYLSVAGQPRAQVCREELKRDWTERMERSIAAQLRTGRELFPVLIADLPGGDHRRDPPERIPNGREVIFKEVDRFILLQREDAPSAEDWRFALRKVCLEDRLAAILTTREPKGEPSISVSKEKGILRGEVTGLDRTASVERWLATCRAELDRLWDDLTA